LSLRRLDGRRVDRHHRSAARQDGADVPPDAARRVEHRSAGWEHREGPVDELTVSVVGLLPVGLVRGFGRVLLTLVLTPELVKPGRPFGCRPADAQLTHKRRRVRVVPDPCDLVVADPDDLDHLELDLPARRRYLPGRGPQRTVVRSAEGELARDLVGCGAL